MTVAGLAAASALAPTGPFGMAEAMAKAAVRKPYAGFELGFRSLKA